MQEENEQNENDEPLEYTDEIMGEYMSLQYEIEKMLIFTEVLEEFLDIDEDCIQDSLLYMAKDRVNSLYKKLDELNEAVADVIAVEDFLENGPGKTIDYEN